jgi:nucleotide-binding universal stress UspA family protein
MKTLLVPVDFSDTAERVLAHAADLARALSGRLVLLHVVEPVATYVPVGASMDVIATVPPPALAAENVSADKSRLATLAAPLAAAGLPVETVVSVGLAVDEILDQAARHEADYIVVGSHGHGALYHLFSGSVVNGILKRAGCPVVVIPGGRH